MRAHLLYPAESLGPPTPIGDVAEFQHNPVITQLLDPAQRASEDVLISLANGYWSTLENNTGELRGTDFTDDCVRFENGKAYPGAKQLFQLGRYRFNERVRDRAFLLIDEERGLVMSRAFIDHKGVLDTYRLTDGTVVESIFREPHSWHMLELFKIASGKIIAIEATFIAVPYFMPTVWPCAEVGRQQRSKPVPSLLETTRDPQTRMSALLTEIRKICRGVPSAMDLEVRQEGQLHAGYRTD